MKKKLILILLAPFLFGFTIHGKSVSKANGRSVYRVNGRQVSNTPSAPSSELCEGGELFCSDFETDVSWDTTTDPEDAALTADGDWTDQDSANAINGTYSLSIRGGATVYVQKQFSETDEFYIEGWFRTPSDLTSWVGPVSVWDTGVSNTVLSFTTSTSTLKLLHNGVTSDLSGTLSPSTTYRFGIYCNQETVPSSSGDGIYRVYIKTSAADFVAGDMKLNITNAETGNVNAAYIRFRGPGTGLINTIDDSIIKSGDPGWPTS